MKVLMIIFILLFTMSSQASLSYRINVQSCLPYIHNGVLYSNCDQQEEIEMQLVEVSPDFYFTQVSKTFTRNEIQFKAIISLVRQFSKDGDEFFQIEGGIKIGKKLITTANSKFIENQTSLILTSHQKIGKMNGKPVLLIGSSTQIPKSNVFNRK